MAEVQGSRIGRVGSLVASVFAVVVGFAVVWRWPSAEAARPSLPESCQAALRDIATTRVVMKMVALGGYEEEGVIRWTSAKDEVVCSSRVDVDFGVPIARLSPDRFVRDGAKLLIRLPTPTVLEPGFRVSDSRILDQRTNRWLSEPKYVSALLAAQRQALADAPGRVKALGVDLEVRDCTRRLLEHLVPEILGEPSLRVEVRFDDEPPPKGTT